MEHGSGQDPSKATFSFVDEDHTLANAVRFTLNQESVFSYFSLHYVLCAGSFSFSMVHLWGWKNLIP